MERVLDGASFFANGNNQAKLVFWWTLRLLVLSGARAAQEVTMSRPHSRSPLYSRNSALPGKREDGFYGEQYHSSVRSDSWRNAENVNKVQGNSHWDNGPSQGEEEVDHWAKFIEAIGHARRRRPSPNLRYQTQDDAQRFEEKPSHSPRRLPRERLSSPEASHYVSETHQRIPSPGRRRNEHDGTHFDRHHSNRAHWDSRGSSPRHSQEKRHDWIEHGHHNEDRYHERGSFSARSLKSNYREDHPHPKRFRGLDPQEEYSVTQRGYSPHNAPVIVEHDHGIPNHDARNRDPPRSHDPLRNREHPRSRDLQRINDLPRSRDPPRGNDLTRGRDPLKTSEPPRSMESLKHRRDHDNHTGITHDRRGSLAVYHSEEETRLHHPSAERRSPMRGRSQHWQQSRVDMHARQRHGQRTMDLTGDVDLRNDKSNRSRSSGHTWEKGTKPGGNDGGALQTGKFSKGIPHHRNLNTNAAPAPRMDFTEHETLRIKVDMSRPVGHSRHLGYSSERQLSLDLVNVGRQRLDFLPMLEHSGTYRESAMHSGTFAQEIITLVHHVKENYFQGQGITLNERFSSEQHYTLEDEDEFAEDEQELEEMKPVINRPLGDSSHTQIFCNIGSWQPQRRQVPAPGDLRHDLERKRQQRLEGVKITIAGGGFSQMAPQSQENEPTYIDEEDVHDAGVDFDWSEQMPQQTEQWDGPLGPVSNFDARQNFSRFGKQRGPRIRRNLNNDASW
ncbi:hypothetical protein AOLI_G00260520 [Acnodon oligacanthus]